MKDVSAMEQQRSPSLAVSWLLAPVFCTQLPSWSLRLRLEGQAKRVMDMYSSIAVNTADVYVDGDDKADEGETKIEVNWSRSHLQREADVAEIYTA